MKGVVVLRLLLVAATLAAVACGQEPGELRADAAAPPSGPSSGLCPAKVVVDEGNIDVRLNAENDPAPLPTFGGRGYAMELREAMGGGSWDGLVVAERLQLATGLETFLAELDPLDLCPFDVVGDAERIRTCGARESEWVVGHPGEPPNRQPALPNRFWDNHFALGGFDIIGRYNAANPSNTIDECRLGCVQNYHCHSIEGDKIPGEFGTALDFVHVAAGGGRTDVFVAKVDVNGDVY